jgi:hypothetical protein
MNNLKIRIRIRFGLVALLVCVSMLLISTAQDTNDTSKLTRYVTGCLQQGHNADEYQLIAENAKWHLRSDSFRLEDYVGQEVKVAGVVSNQPYHGMKEDLKAAVGKKPTETGVLTVTNLEIVSNSCN